MNTFLSNRNFKLWAYTVSHSFLIIRSPMLFEDVEGYDENYNYNIDIEFISVVYLDIPNKLLGIEIHELEGDNIPKQFESYRNFKVFEIISNHQTYYIVAGSYLIATNKWIDKHRILDMSLKYDSILGISS